MSLEITTEIEEMVQTILRTGEYESEAEVLHEALTLLKDRDRLRLDINQGLSELDRGERLEGDKVFAELEEKVAQLSKNGQ
jgi:antitoxin ParD1/3/4